MLSADPTHALRLLVLPHLPRRARRDADFGQAPPDAVVLTEFSGWGQVHNHLAPARAAVIPVIDVSGDCPGADFRIPEFTAAKLARALREIAPILQNIARLPARFFTHDEPLRWLLARMAVRNRLLEPDMRVAPATYPEANFIANTDELAETLAQMGLLAQRICERFKICPRCQSKNLHVRLGCICVAGSPRCTCGAGRDISGVRFSCAGCGQHGSYDTLAEVSVYGYDLTDEGHKAAYSTDDLSSFMPGARERTKFLEQMHGIVAGRLQFSDALLQIRECDHKKPLQARMPIYRMIYERLLPLAVPHIFDGCVIVQFVNQSGHLRDALPHLRDILVDIEPELKLNLISPRDILALAAP